MWLKHSVSNCASAHLNIKGKVSDIERAGDIQDHAVKPFHFAFCRYTQAGLTFGAEIEVVVVFPIHDTNVWNPQFMGGKKDLAYVGVLRGIPSETIIFPSL